MSYRTLFCAAALCLCGAIPALADTLVEQGRRIYVEGVLPDGSLLTATRFDGSSTVTGAQAACINCHRRSGYGVVEGRVDIPPVAGAVLFSPGVFASRAARHPTVSAVERFRSRSAYDEKKLLRALSKGRDPDGVPLRPPMARYHLDHRSVAALAAYLRALSSSAVPGMDGATLHLGTVITPDVPFSRREALLEVLRAYAADRSSNGLRWQLHLWQLTGSPEEWEAQLDAYSRQQPVFALLSGVGAVEWGPVHRFCERHALACVLPSLEMAPDGDDYYSLYFSQGLGLEARLLARHLVSAQPARLIQVVADEAGGRAAKAVEQALEHAASSLEMREVSPAGYAAMAPLPGDAVVLWLHAQEVVRLAERAQVPSGTIYLSAQLAPMEEAALPLGWQKSLRYVSVFDVLAASRAQVSLAPWLERHGLGQTELRSRGDAYAACDFFNTALSTVQLQTASGIAGPLTRERLLEALESGLTLFRDDGAPYYRELSLGPGQRFLVKGGRIYRHDGAGGWAALTERIVP